MSGAADRNVALSVVIPVRNGGPDLEAQLDALAEQRFADRWEIVVSDNGSTDGTPQLVERRQASMPNLRLVDSSDRPGGAHAINVGVTASAGELVLLLDADDVVDTGYLDAMADALSVDELVASRLDVSRLNEPWLRESRPAPQTDGVGSSLGFLPSGAGCSLGFRRAVFELVGGFDAGLVMGNDIDFCWRAQLAGVSLAFVPAAVVHYRYRPTVMDGYRQARIYGTVGPVLFQKYRDLGMARRSWRSAVRFHLGPLKRLLRVPTRARLAELMFLVGYRVGLVQGCLRARVLYI